MTTTSLRNSVLVFTLYALAFSLSVSARPATFLQDFKVFYADYHVKQAEGGRAIQLVLDQSSGMSILYVLRLIMFGSFCDHIYMSGPGIDEFQEVGSVPDTNTLTDVSA